MGVVTGAISNVSRTFSLNARDPSSCRAFDGIEIVGPMNQWREQSFRGIGLMPFFPVYHLAPATLLAIGNGFKKEGGTPRTALSVIKKMGSNIHQIVLSPWIRNIPATCLVLWFRSRYQLTIESSTGIDVSGHASFHTIYLFQLCRSLKALYEKGSNWQGNAATLLLAGLSLIELPWTYNTIANCHSVADIACGAVLGILCWAVADKVASRCLARQ